MSLDHLPPNTRPREKLLAHGPAALADAELLALLLRTGLKGRSVLQLAQDLLDTFGGWPGLLNAQVADLGRVKGLGPAKRAEIAAVLEIARRSLHSELAERPVLNSPESLKRYCRLHLGALPFEAFAVLFLNSHYHLIKMEVLFRGSLTRTSVHPREVARRALELGAAAVVLTHNHPSGLAEPSQADELLTRHLSAALGLLEVRVLDHVVVSASGALSMTEQGLM